MNIEETREIINFASLIEGREFHPNAPEAWSMVLADVPVQEARIAVVLHYHESKDSLLPAHLNDQRKRWTPDLWDDSVNQDGTQIGRDEIRERKFKEDADRLGIDPSEMLKGV